MQPGPGVNVAGRGSQSVSSASGGRGTRSVSRPRLLPGHLKEWPVLFYAKGGAKVHSTQKFLLHLRMVRFAPLVKVVRLDLCPKVGEVAGEALCTEVAPVAR